MVKKVSTTIKAKSIFDHLAGIKEKKTSWESLTDIDKKSFSPFIINRWLSMNVDLLPIVNILQKYTIGVLSVRDVYKVYLEFLPKQKTFDKYIKGKSEGKYNSELIKLLSNWYKVSERECIEYLELLPKEEVLKIVMNYGIAEKDAKKLLK
jgi:hypothetical protein